MEELFQKGEALKGLRILDITWITWAKENTDPDKASWKPEALAGTIVLDLSYGSFA